MRCHILIYLLSISAISNINLAIADRLNPPSLTSAEIISFEETTLLQAVNDDLAGLPQLARKGYDSLLNSPLADKAAIPSAINYFSLNKTDDALRVFEAIQRSSNERDAQYARLWLARIIIQQHKGPKSKLTNSLAALLKTNWRLAYEKAIANLYLGHGSVDDIYAVIMAQPDLSAQQMRDALTESTFFAAGFLQYVEKDNSAALKLYEQYQRVLNNGSLEHPLITREIKSLKNS